MVKEHARFVFFRGRTTMELDLEAKKERCRVYFCLRKGKKKRSNVETISEMRIFYFHFYSNQMYYLYVPPDSRTAIYIFHLYPKTLADR